MGKSFAVVALLVSAFCFSSVLARKAPPTGEEFFVEGKIYCDPCRFEFESRLSHPLSGVKVTLECKKPDSDNVTYVKDVVTDTNGIYSIPVHGDHEEEICDVNAGESPNGECNESMKNQADRIVLTKNMGVSSLKRYVNPLGFKTQAVDPQCFSVFKELGLDNLDD
ncbi:olee1-like protein [Gastrolobium bilobum]|uniref:olee1-like protein n=1 Tax=Gastrolobium bilobum TaxID=150636 RepID=UPI002AB0F6EA|nr:olee1-like protein [Gastrolobium bilobum]